jgi:hypothetical protein
MMMDCDQGGQGDAGEEMNAEIEDFSQPTYRGMRVNGCLGGYVPTWSSQNGWSGM